MTFPCMWYFPLKLEAERWSLTCTYTFQPWKIWNPLTFMNSWLTPVPMVTLQFSSLCVLAFRRPHPSDREKQKQYKPEKHKWSGRKKECSVSRSDARRVYIYIYVYFFMFVCFDFPPLNNSLGYHAIETCKKITPKSTKHTFINGCVMNAYNICMPTPCRPTRTMT